MAWLTRSSPLARAGVLVLALVVAAGVAWYVASRRTAPPSPTEIVPPTWTTARDAPMHVRHVREGKIACTQCHARDDEKPDASVCAKCHGVEDAKHHAGSQATPTTCLTCHAFGLAQPATCNGCHAEPSATGKPTRAAGAPALEHHASADLACSTCHRAHADTRASSAVGVDCTRCHDTKTSAAHGPFTAEGLPTALADGGAGGGGRGPDHVLAAWISVDGGGSGAGARDRDGGGARGAPFCVACHAPHTGKAAALATCAGCHAAEKNATASHEANVTRPGHPACVTCHEPHRARRAEVKACAGCHADRRAALDDRGHRACTGCHAPHAPGAERTSCPTCHTGTTALASDRVAAHADCTSCHDVHRPDVAPGDACAKCHASTKPSHPATTSRTGAQSCAGCHPPHAGSALKPAILAASGSSHASRGALSSIASACTACHAKPLARGELVATSDVSAHGGKAACAECHTPHAFQVKDEGAKLCARCHADNATKTLSRPGHARCDACHGAAHAPTAKPACVTCHAEETKTAPPGHAKCTSCHDAHSGSRAGHEACTSCHANKASALHAHATAQGCSSCHRPHGAGPSAAAGTRLGPAEKPACTTCHDRASRGGLHGVQAHEACASCHSAHAAPRSDRATCTTTCHADRRNHQPDATTCKGCHLFRTAR